MVYSRNGDRSIEETCPPAISRATTGLVGCMRSAAAVDVVMVSILILLNRVLAE